MPTRFGIPFNGFGGRGQPVSLLLRPPKEKRRSKSEMFLTVGRSGIKIEMDYFENHFPPPGAAGRLLQWAGRLSAALPFDREPLNKCARANCEEICVKKRRKSAGILTDFKILQRIYGGNLPQGAAAAFVQRFHNFRFIQRTVRVFCVRRRRTGEPLCCCAPVSRRSVG